LIAALAGNVTSALAASLPLLPEPIRSKALNQPARRREPATSHWNTKPPGLSIAA
jgi:hypothetical protein